MNHPRDGMMTGKGVIKQVKLVVLTKIETNIIRLSSCISRVRQNKCVYYVNMGSLSFQKIERFVNKVFFYRKSTS